MFAADLFLYRACCGIIILQWQKGTVGMRLTRRDLGLRALYNFGDDMGKGRCTMLFSVVAQNVIAWMTGSLFYTSFLLHNGINLVNIGIITAIPLLSNVIAVFSPFILESFPRRRYLLMAGRITYYTLNLLCITLVPEIFRDPSARVTAFVVLLFTANIVNAMCGCGYTVWHLNFIPGDLRAGYFASSTRIAYFFGLGLGVVSAFIADSFSGSPHEYTVVVALRYIAYALGITEAILLALPREFPYPQTNKPRFTDIVTKPLKHPKFRMTMVIMFIYCMGQNVSSGALSAYLLDQAHVTFTFVQLINFMYPVFMTIFARSSTNTIRRLGWYRAFALYTFIQFPTTIAYACVNASNVWILLPVVRLTQHWMGATANVAAQNIPFLNAPRENQSNYISFNAITSNLGAFLGVSLGTAFIKYNPGLDWNVLGFHFCNVQVLVLAWAAFQIIVPAVTILLLKKYRLEEVQST